MDRVIRKPLVIVVVLIVAATLTIGARYVVVAGPAGAGFAAKQLCSLVFYAGLDPKRAQSLYVDSAVFPLSLSLAASYDDKSRQVSVSGFGVFSARAQMRDGLGCTLITALDTNDNLPPVTLPSVVNKPLARASTDEVATVFDVEQVNEAVKTAFATRHNTLAVAVLHRGKLVAEGYAETISSNTPLPGWSMAKSVTATLVGILVNQGRLDVNAPGAVAVWRTETDGRADVTLDQLLRMTSGVDIVEHQSGTDPTTRMLLLESDAAAYAAGRGLKAPPGTHWEYTSGNSVLVSRILVEASGGTLRDSQIFMRRHLFMPLGAATFVMEPDLSGTFIGSSFVLASAHDWAKFGQLYLSDGVWDGKRLLPQGWRDYVTRVTRESGNSRYGAGFWRARAGSSLPEDTFFANGFQGQYVVVIPSHELVVVRLGASHGSGGTWQLVEGVIAATR